MTQPADAEPLSQHDMAAILAVTRALAAPFELRAMLAEVTAAACTVLRAERSSVLDLSLGLMFIWLLSFAKKL